MKRYCQTLELMDDPDMIRRYCDVHKHVWPEIMEGQKQVGILDMQIFRRGTHVFMICDTVDDFDWERDWEKLAGMPRQAEWEAYVAKAQGADPTLPSHKKWRLMEKIFELEK
jgi:L-rhamnose mutarotase